MRILFVCLSEPWTPYSPSIAALSAAVRASGHEPACLSIPLETSVREAADKIAALAPDVVGASVMTRDWPGIRTLLLRVKQRSPTFVVVGGYHATLAARQVSKCAAVDAVCIGEGELSLPTLLDTLERGDRPVSRRGLWVRGPDGFDDPIPPGGAADDIATLPSWDYEVFGPVSDLLARGINILGGKKDRFLPTRASRGCPFNCTYCSAPRWGKASGFDGEGKRNVHPVTDLCNELASLRDRHQPDGFEFWDEHFPVDVAWLAELAREYPRRVGLPFRIEMHPSAATRERLEHLATAGCSLFHCGVEAGDPVYRKNVLNRRSSDATLQRVFDDAHELGMETSASVMMALPSETVRQVEMTLELLRRLKPRHVICSTYVPLPGTTLGGEMFELETPDVERFDDFRKCAPVIDYPRMTGDEVDDLHRRFAELQRELDAQSVGR